MPCHGCEVLALPSRSTAAWTDRFAGLVEAMPRVCGIGCGRRAKQSSFKLGGDPDRLPGGF